MCDYMSNTVFSVALDALHMAKLEEIMKKYPNKSRNAVIKEVIDIVHSGKLDDLLQVERDLHMYYDLYMKLLEAKK